MKGARTGCTAVFLLLLLHNIAATTSSIAADHGGAAVRREPPMAQRLSFQRLFFQTGLKIQSLIGQSFVSVPSLCLGVRFEAAAGAKGTYRVHSLHGYGVAGQEGESL